MKNFSQRRKLRSNEREREQRINCTILQRRIVCEKIKDKRIDDKSGRSYDTGKSYRDENIISYRLCSKGKKRERIINKPKRLNFLDKNLCNFLIFLSAILRVAITNAF